MFITKTMNESVEQFDLVDSICESYEDLININEALARFDIKEQELICTESTELDTFREDAIERAKEMFAEFIAKLKMKYQAFVKWVNTQITNLFKNKLDKYLSKNKDKLNKALAWYKETNKTPSGKANYASRYLHKAIVKNNKIVSLNEFIDKASDELYNVLYDDLDISNPLETDSIMKKDAVALFKERVEKNVGKFEAITTNNDKTLIYPVASFNDFESVIKTMDGVVGSGGYFDKSEKELKAMINASKASPQTYKLFTWRYIQFTKMVNIFLSMSRRYFMTCLISVSSLIKIYEDNRDKE
jgi:hypothetical protein